VEQLGFRLKGGKNPAQGTALGTFPNNDFKP
jgi:hypothetical protein